MARNIQEAEARKGVEALLKQEILNQRKLFFLLRNLHLVEKTKELQAMFDFRGYGYKGSAKKLAEEIANHLDLVRNGIRAELRATKGQDGSYAIIITSQYGILDSGYLFGVDGHGRS